MRIYNEEEFSSPFFVSNLLQFMAILHLIQTYFVLRIGMCITVKFTDWLTEFDDVNSMFVRDSNIGEKTRSIVIGFNFNMYCEHLYLNLALSHEYTAAHIGVSNLFNCTMSGELFVSPQFIYSVKKRRRKTR